MTVTVVGTAFLGAIRRVCACGRGVPRQTVAVPRDDCRSFAMYVSNKVGYTNKQPKLSKLTIT